MAASMLKEQPPKQHQVFINFRGAELRKDFISHLVKALGDGEIKYYIDTKEVPGKSLEILFKRIDESDIALAVFSERYSESRWCLDELVKIMQNVEEKKLKVIPIFMKLTVDDVKKQEGKFGLNFSNIQSDEKKKAWKEALQSATKIMGLRSKEYRYESDFIIDIVKSVKSVIGEIEGGEGTKISSQRSNGNVPSRDIIEKPKADPSRYGKCLEQLKEKIDFGCKETQIVGIVGMPGIGKTTLAEMLFKVYSCRFNYSEIFRECRKNSIDHDWVKDRLLGAQSDRPEDEKVKVFVVLDDVSDKKQLEFLQMDRGSIIKEGSKIVITTRDKGLIEGLAHDIYVVPGLNDKEALELFTYHAFNDQDNTPTASFIEMSKMFVDYAGGNPLALEELGMEMEICGTDEASWKQRLEKLPHQCNGNIRRKLEISYDDLTKEQKHAFLDIACFLRSEEEDYVRILLESDDTTSGEAGREVRELADKFLINISAGRIEMHSLLCTMGKEIGSSVQNNSGKTRLWNHEDAHEALVLKKGTYDARGIFLDTSKLAKEIPLESKALMVMRDLRYFKLFDSHCPRQCDVVDCKVNLPEGLKFPLKEIRYLHWLKFPLEELPSDFNPENLIDLRLHYSKIQRVWKETKNTPKLKWVDLSHSTQLTDLSSLSNAESLRRLILEGCTKLSEFPEDMKNLAFLNLRGCTSLVSLPKMKNLTSLKTLILSDCSKFKEFQVISENLEYLHLGGTAIKGLPSTMQNLGRLIVLNLKDCKKLKSLPDCLHKLKTLEELILSGCSMLSTFPDVKEIMENLQILLLDGTSIKELPDILCGNLQCGNNSIALQQNHPRTNELSLLRRLCLSGNDMINSLQSSISQLYHLKEIDLKRCENLTSLSTLPPNLQCLDAHDCVKLKTVGSPLALLMPQTERVPSSFLFTNCEKLEHVAKNEIICYAHKKSRLMSDALNRHNKGLAFEALVSPCFPGSEVPTWFNHRASGAELKPELPQHWYESGFVGIALCAIVSFQDYKVQNNNFMVKCNFEFNNSCSFNCNVGGLSEAGDEQRTLKSTHVFIGYTSWLNLKIYQEEVGKKLCVGPSEASIKFNVIDGTCEATRCEVLKCGFSLVCESDPGSWDANVDASPTVCESENGSCVANVDASPTVCESDNGSCVANVDENPVVQDVRRGERRFFGLLRRGGWIF